MIPRLGDSPDAPFPPVEEALSHPDGLLAWGGDLHPRRLINAYSAGIFPWYGFEDPVLWWSPARRCVLFPDQVHVARRLARTLRQRPFEFTADRAFDAVIGACAGMREQTWITPAMQEAYTRLHDMGLAHSVEAWSEGKLVGGVYGLGIGRAFFGESMFSRRSDASKAALVALCRVLRHWDFSLLDCQVENPHLQRMGASMIARDRFLGLLDDALAGATRTQPWTQDFPVALEAAWEF